MISQVLVHQCRANAVSGERFQRGRDQSVANLVEQVETPPDRRDDDRRSRPQRVTRPANNRHVLGEGLRPCEGSVRFVAVQHVQRLPD